MKRTRALSLLALSVLLASLTVAQSSSGPARDTDIMKTIRAAHFQPDGNCPLLGP